MDETLDSTFFPRSTGWQPLINANASVLAEKMNIHSFTKSCRTPRQYPIHI